MTAIARHLFLKLAGSLLLTSGLVACSKSPVAPPPATPEVSVVVIQPQVVRIVNDLPGRVAPLRVAQVRARVDGVVLKREFTEGADVKVGQKLYWIDPAPYQAEVNSSNAALARAKANATTRALQATRSRELLKKHAISQQDFDDISAAQKQAKADVDAAAAVLDAARIRLSYTDVRSPIDGRIGKSQVTEGAYVRQSDATLLATVQQLDSVYVDVAQSNAEVLRLRQDFENSVMKKVDKDSASVSLKLEDGSAYSELGRLQFSDISVDESTGSVTLRAIFPNTKHLLLPGMFVHAQLEVGVDQQGLLVPQQAVTYNTIGQATALIVNAENVVEQRMLQTNRSVGNQWLVTKGIQAGDRVITEGLQKIKPGVVVKVAPPAGSPAVADK
ncbi:MAG: efflux RND transporter periplasmic adaptor subunit [Pseudomonadales bacterium]|jgi:membrane fusion protein (multidrug efflux system)